MNKLDIIFSSIGVFLLSILTLNHWYRGLYYEPLALLLLIVISPTVYHFMRLLYLSLLNNKKAETHSLSTSYDELKEMDSLKKAQIDEMSELVKSSEIRWNTDWSYNSWQDYKEGWSEPVYHDFCNTCGYATQGCVCEPIVNKPTDSQ